jgi:hypothetical protein
VTNGTEGTVACTVAPAPYLGARLPNATGFSTTTGFFFCVVGGLEALLVVLFSVAGCCKGLGFVSFVPGAPKSLPIAA